MERARRGQSGPSRPRSSEHLVTPSGMKIAHTAEDLAEYAGLTEVARVSDVLNPLSHQASGANR